MLALQERKMHLAGLPLFEGGWWPFPLGEKVPEGRMRRPLFAQVGNSPHQLGRASCACVVKGLPKRSDSECSRKSWPPKGRE